MSSSYDQFGAAPPQADDGAAVPSAWPSLTEPTRLVPLWPPAQRGRTPAAEPQPQFPASATPAAYPTEANSTARLAVRDDQIGSGELERWAQPYGVDFTPTTSDGQLRAMAYEREEAQTPASEAATVRDRIEAELDAFARARGLPWQEKRAGSISPQRYASAADVAEDTSDGGAGDTRAALERRAAELGINVAAETPDGQLRAQIFEALEARTAPQNAGVQSARFQAELDRAAERLGISLKAQPGDGRGIIGEVKRTTDSAVGSGRADGEAAASALPGGAPYAPLLDPARVRLYAPPSSPATEVPPIVGVPRLPVLGLGTALTLPLMLHGDTPVPPDTFPVRGRDDFGTRVVGDKMMIYKAPSSWLARQFDDGTPLTALDLKWRNGRRILDADGREIGTLANDKVELSPEALAALDARVKEGTQAAAPAVEPRGQADDDTPRVCPDPSPKNEAMSADARAYQQQITGLPANFHMILNGVDYDGCDQRTGNMLDAKARYAQFLDEAGTKWKEWFEKSSWPAMLAKAKQQNKAVMGTGRRVEYHCAEEEVANLLRELFAYERLTYIDVKWTKRKIPSAPDQP